MDERPHPAGQPGSWQISCELGRDALGKRRNRAITVLGTKAYAKRKLREVLTALDDGDRPEPTDIPLRQWLDRWMQEVLIPARRQNTADRYRGTIRTHIGNILLGKFSPTQRRRCPGHRGRQV